MMTEIQTIDGGQKDAHIKRENINKKTCTVTSRSTQNIVNTT